MQESNSSKLTISKQDNLIDAWTRILAGNCVLTSLSEDGSKSSFFLQIFLQIDPIIVAMRKTSSSIQQAESSNQPKMNLQYYCGFMLVIFTIWYIRNLLDFVAAALHLDEYYLSAWSRYIAVGLWKLKLYSLQKVSPICGTWIMNTNVNVTEIIFN
jgi:hypothetical protein